MKDPRYLMLMPILVQSDFVSNFDFELSVEPIGLMNQPRSDFSATPGIFGSFETAFEAAGGNSDGKVEVVIITGGW